MAELVVRRKDDFVVEYIGGNGAFVDAGEEHFTIDVADETWGLPNPGWDKENREAITLEEVPAGFDGFNSGTSKLLGTEGNYSWEH